MDEMIYLLVGADDDAEAERRGAQWDPVLLRWFIRHDQDPGPFLEWLPIEELDEEDEIPLLCVEPPLLVAEMMVACPRCASPVPVIALLAAEFGCDEQEGVKMMLGKATESQQEPGSSAYAAGDEPYADAGDETFEDDEDEELAAGALHPAAGLMRFHHLRQLPEAVAAALTARYPFFRKIPSPVGDTADYRNTCGSCGEPFADAELHARPGRGFYPLSAEAAKAILLRPLPPNGRLLLRARYSQVEPDLIGEHARRAE